MERSSRRAASRVDAAKEKLNALREAKAGGNNKRVLDYELKREDDIYDEVRAARWPCALHTPPHTQLACMTRPSGAPSRWCTDARSLFLPRPGPRGVVACVFCPACAVGREAVCQSRGQAASRDGRFRGG
jgi:hypothetical protein